MQLKLEQLSSHLAEALAPVYVVSGDEPLLVNEALDAIRAAARDRGFSERTVLDVEPKFDWHRLAAESQNRSLFAERRLLDLRMPSPKPGDAGAKALAAWAAAPEPDTLLLLSTGQVDGRTRRARWYGALEATGAALQIWPVEVARLPQWIERRMRAAGLAATAAACAELAERVEGNLLACAQEIDKLRLLHGKGTIDVSEVRSAAADSARFQTFDLVDYTLAGNAARALRVLSCLRSEGVPPLLVSGTLAWQIRALAGMAARRAAGASLDEVFRSNPAWSRRRPALSRALERRPPRAWLDLLVALGRIDRMIKGAEAGDPWDEIEALCLAVCGLDLRPGRAASA